MTRLGLQEASQFHCWIVVNGEVLDQISEGDDQAEERFLKAIFEYDDRLKDTKSQNAQNERLEMLKNMNKNREG